MSFGKRVPCICGDFRCFEATPYVNDFPGVGPQDPPPHNFNKQGDASCVRCRSRCKHGPIPPVVSLAAIREKKEQVEHEKAHALHENGELLKFEPFEYSDVEPFGVGLMSGDMPICIVMNKNLSGICMTRESARRLGEALVECAEEGIINEVYEPPEPPEAG